MAKTLEKVTKEFDVLVTEISALHQEAAEVESDFIQLRTLAKEFAHEAGREAAELNKKGHLGTCLDDFRGEKAVKAYLKKWDEQESTAKRLDAKIKKVIKDFPSKYKKLGVMADELEDEIANREKKANRKIFKIQSESLPDLKKLLVKIKKAVNDFDDTIDRANESQRDTSSGFDVGFEEEFESVYKKSTKDRKLDEVREMAAAAKNVRVQLKYLREGREMQQEIKQLCVDAAKALKKGDSPQQFLDSARETYHKMDKTAKIQQRMLDTFGANTKKNATGDAKKVIDSATAYVAINKQTLALLNKTTSACMAAAPSRKGKEKV